MAIMLIAVLSISCKGEQKKKITQEQSAEFTVYFQIKDALVGDDLDQVKYAVAENNLQDAIRTENIDVAREDFFVWTQALEKVLEENAYGEVVYKQQCPMAFDNSGAYWFSLEEKVYNPYFGAQMLRCGSVQATYEK